MKGCGKSCMLYCWTCMKLAIKLLQMPRFVTDKAHPQIRCHLVFVSSMGCGKFSYYHLPAMEVEARRGSVTFQRTSLCEPHTSSQIPAHDECTVSFPFYCSYVHLYKYHMPSVDTLVCHLHTYSHTVALIPGQVWVHNSNISIRSLIPHYVKPQLWTTPIPVMSNGLSS